MNVLCISSGPCAVLRAASRRVTRATTATLKFDGEPGSGPRSLTTSRGWSGSNSRPRLRQEATWSGTRHVSWPLHRPASGHRAIFSASGPGIIRRYEDVPKDYRDQTGLRFSARHLSDEEIAHIFGRGLDAAAGNRLLRILHGRRVAGTLEDPAFAAHTAQYPGQLIASGLGYLREKVQVNEVLNAGLRAEDELNQMDRELAEREARQQEESDGGDARPVVAEADPVYGRSTFDRIRARNVARQKASDRAAEEQGLAVGVAGPLARREDGSTRAVTNPKIAEYYEKAQSKLEAPPELKTWERVLPSATLVVLVLGALGALASVYDEPAPRHRLLGGVSTAHATVGTLVALNALVLLGWRVPPLWRLFNKHMILVVATARPVTVLTAMFSHTKLGHMLVNMVPLWFVGTALHEELGRARFLTLYLGCGAVGFLGSLLTYTLRGWLTVTSLGASGATLGLCSAYFWEHRDDGFRILGLPPGGVHGIVFLALITAVQMAALGRTARLRVDVASHLSGMVAGIVGVEVLGRRRGARTRGGREGDSGREVIEVWGDGGGKRG